MAEDLDKTEKGWNNKNSISPILKNIPVFLLKSESMPDTLSTSDQEKASKENSSEEGRSGNYLKTEPFEYMGFYMRSIFKGGRQSEKKPSVFVCPERVLSCSNGMRPGNSIDLSYQELLASVIIHEFAHAIMDFFNENFFINTESEIFKWVEEPFANWFVLKYIESMGNGAYFQRITKYMEGNPDNYKLGLNFYMSNVSDLNWKDWTHKKKSGIEAKMEEDWLQFAKSVTQIEENVFGELCKLLKS